MRTQALSAIFLGGLFALSASGQGNTGPRTTEVKKAATLEDDIARAVQSHPDVRVAEAEAQLANAKLQQTKQAVAQRVAAAKREKDRAAEELTLAKKSFEAAFIASAKIGEQLKTLRMLGAATGKLEMIQLETTFQQYEVTKVEHERAMAAAKAKLATAEAEYESMAGKAADEMAVIRKEQVPKPVVTYAPQIKPGSAMDQLRLSMHKSVKLEAMKSVDLATVYATLLKAADVDCVVRIPIIEDPKITKEVVKIKLPAGELSLATWIQLINDDTTEYLIYLKDDQGLRRPKRYEIYVREYGLLLVDPDSAPEDAYKVADFAKYYRAAKPAEPKK